MKVLTLKIEQSFLKSIERAMKKNHYSTKTEFIREALREKLEHLDKEERIKQLSKVYGMGKEKYGNLTDKDLKKSRKKVEKEIKQNQKKLDSLKLSD